MKLRDISQNHLLSIIEKVITLINDALMMMMMKMNIPIPIINYIDIFSDIPVGKIISVNGGQCHLLFSRSRYSACAFDHARARVFPPLFAADESKYKIY